MDRSEVVIVGAGLAGLACARKLVEAGVPCRIVDGADGPGGRVRTDEVDGFLLDRGFQVLLTAYPECREVLDYPALGLRPFYPGAVVRREGRFCRIADPWRRPLHALASAVAAVGTLGDKLRVAKLRSELRRIDLDTLFSRPETSTLDALRERGFTAQMIDGFFRPFLGGVFLEEDLATSSRMFEFVFKMFSEGDTALPTRGMGAIPESMAAALPSGTVRYDTRVESVAAGEVRLTDGEALQAATVVVATDASEACRLVPELGTAPAFRSTVCLYYDAPSPPIDEPVLVLNGEPEGPVNTLCVPSRVSAAYAPPGRSLISVSLRSSADGTDPDAGVRAQLGRWFGETVGAWRLLATYRVPQSLPVRSPLDPVQLPVRVDPGLVVCGDHREHASIQGALVSGRRAADAILDA